jgi:mannose-6-phosphate isomerase-like protein (cupin superfamily)
LKICLVNGTTKFQVNSKFQHKGKILKLAFYLALLTSGLIYRAAAADTPSTGVIQIDNQAVAAAFAKGGLLIKTNDFKVMAGRRVEPGAVEIHEKDTDVFYITEGSATFVTGGTAVKPHTVAPGEIQASEITGGESHHLTKGDVIIIPNGVPHQFTEVNDPFLYFVVKVSK